LSRITGFARDIVLAAVLGAGPIADAFFVALRLPNHFRAIFAEGAQRSFVLAYARIASSAVLTHRVCLRIACSRDDAKPGRAAAFARLHAVGDQAAGAGPG
jgi:hypothetical protein